MLPTELDYLARKEQRQDMLRALEKGRLISLINEQRSHRPGRYRQSLAWLGGRLVEWGSTLERYGTPPTSESRVLRLP
jgi:hypothetical protein